VVSESEPDGGEMTRTALARRLRSNPTEAETTLWQKINHAQLGVKFRRQQPISHYVVDFFCPELKLIVEVDGGQHAEGADINRDKWLVSEGYIVKHYWNNEVLGNIDGVVSDIMTTIDSLSPPPQPSPLKGEGVFRDPVLRVRALVEQILPFDSLEAQHLAETLSWIDSGAQIFRLQKPATLPKHLVSYFVVFDAKAQKVLLVDHKKALLWLPAGGHVEPDEDPADTVRRECREELGIDARFWRETPIFLTCTVTVGLTAGHTDVSLWYVILGDVDHPYVYDTDEFNGIKWFGLDDIPFDRADPHMQRFVEKLQTLLRTS
jgi:8-oxo-dGTP diphosphatase